MIPTHNRISHVTHTVSGSWTEFNSREYAAATGMAYFCFLLFMAAGVALLVFQGAVTEELGIGERGPLLTVCTHALFAGHTSWASLHTLAYVLISDQHAMRAAAGF